MYKKGKGRALRTVSSLPLHDDQVTGAEILLIEQRVLRIYF